MNGGVKLKIKATHKSLKVDNTDTTMIPASRNKSGNPLRKANKDRTHIALLTEEPRPESGGAVAYVSFFVLPLRLVIGAAS